MPPHRALPRSSTGYHGVRLRLSGRWGAEITRGGERFWLGTFDSAELAARAYDVMVWRYDGGAGPRNFFDVNNLAAAEFVAPPPRRGARCPPGIHADVHPEPR
nr:ethylene-responsive transcription factor ERF084-like [Lolium perenne]